MLINHLSRSTDQEREMIEVTEVDVIKIKIPIRKMIGKETEIITEIDLIEIEKEIDLIGTINLGREISQRRRETKRRKIKRTRKTRRIRKTKIGGEATLAVVEIAERIV